MCTRRFAFALVLAIAGSLAGAVAATAGTEVAVGETVGEVPDQVGEALRELQIEPAEPSVAPDPELTGTQARSGARVLVQAGPGHKSDCPLSEDTGSVDDADIEARFLRLMQAR